MKPDSPDIEENTSNTTNSVTDSSSLSYRDAGVNIDAGNRLISRIKPAVKRTMRPEVLGGLGGFGGLFELPVDRYKKPILVSGTDGVGTKLKLAIELAQHDTVGIDLVAMCVNDILVHGAEPLFFLDYYATGKLDVNLAAAVIKGIATGCEQAGAALIGGETAEMPGMYQDDDYDLAGFCVGIVEKDDIIDGSSIKDGDVLIGIGSSGPHSNGYSLIRKILTRSGVDHRELLHDKTLGQHLLAPTIIYVKPILDLLTKIKVKAMAHITGGGLPENIPRVLPTDIQALIDTKSWPRPPIFDWLQQHGNVTDEEMYRTFNCGIGLVLCVNAEDASSTLTHFRSVDLPSWEIGTVTQSSGPASVELR